MNAKKSLFSMWIVASAAAALLLGAMIIPALAADKPAKEVIPPEVKPMVLGDKPTDVPLEPLFNGKDLTGWKVPAENPWWKAVDGVLVGNSDEKKKGNVLYTEKSYKDVVVETEVRFPDDIDSGIFFRKPELQVQIGVSRSLKKDMTCSIYAKRKIDKGAHYIGVAQGVDKLLKLNEWNTIRTEIRGPVTKVWLNGTHVLTFEAEDFAGEGPIGLQIHPGVVMKVEFKNMKVGELK